MHKYCTAISFLPKSHYIDALRLSSLISPLIKTWEVFSSITRALLRFHFTSSPGRLYAKQHSARLDSPCQLALHPAGCLTMQSAAHLWPGRLHSQFYHNASKKARNAVKGFRSVWGVRGRKERKENTVHSQYIHPLNWPDSLEMFIIPRGWLFIILVILCLALLAGQRPFDQCFAPGQLVLKT